MDKSAAAVQSLVAHPDRAVMPIQPWNNDIGGLRLNGCWVPLVIAIASFYCKVEATIDSVLALADGDEEESVCEVLKAHFGIRPAPWKGVGREIWYDGIEDPGEEDGGMFELDDGGFERTSETWFAALRTCVARDDLAVILVLRLEASETRSRGAPATHYLLVLGVEEWPGRRGHTARTLLVKDPMEGGTLLQAHLECDAFNGGKMVLHTQRSGGGVLDRFRPFECVHLGVAPIDPRQAPI